MFKTSLLLSFLSAMLSVESPGKTLERPMQNKAQDISFAMETELTDEEQIEADARRNVGHSLVDE